MGTKFTIDSFQKCKENGTKIKMLTAYDYSMAKILDQAGVDAILIGDSLGMVMLGYENTLPVTINDIIYHTKAVMRGIKNAFVVADMPFLSYHISDEETIRNAGEIIKQTNAHAVKLEGGSEFAETISKLIRAQIPVMGHIGLTPQSINVFGGFKVQGKSEIQAKKLIEDALALEKAGVFAIVLECIPRELAEIISNKLTIPTIGIGAGKDCDGQILVVQDFLGMYSDFAPKFVKQYTNLKPVIENAVTTYCDEVQSGSFPDNNHSFALSEDTLAKLQQESTDEKN